MLPYTLKRLLQAVPVLILSTIFVFLLLHLSPGDPALNLLGVDAAPEEIEAVRSKLGLDKPLPVQYGIWLGNVLKGDLGTSFIHRRPVAELIGQRLLATVQLALAAILIAILLSFLLGVVSAMCANKPVDWLINGVTAGVIAAPNFWLGILGILLFAVVLKWLPPGGRVGFTQDPVLALKAIILPAAVISIRQTAVLTRFVRASVLDVLGENYVRTAHAKGLSVAAVIIHHVLRNSLIPVITVLGVRLGRLLGGVVIIEAVFAWPGVGRLLVDSIRSRDFPIAQGVLLLMAVIFVLVNIVTDLLYGIIDPRVRLAGRQE